MRDFQTYGLPNRGLGATSQRAFSDPRVEAAASEFLWKVYRWMSLGLGVTGLVAFVVANTPALTSLIFGNPFVFYGLLIGEVVMVIAFTGMVGRVSFGAAAAMFLAYAAVNGLTMSFVFLVYTRSSVTQVFFITAGAFAALSVFGTTTKRNLSGMGRAFGIALVGLIIASVVNWFLQSPQMYWLLSIGGVVIFAGLTAYYNQQLKQLYLAHGERGNIAIHGALLLYLAFINLFLYLLRLFGRRR